MERIVPRKRMERPSREDEERRRLEEQRKARAIDANAKGGHIAGEVMHGVDLFADTFGAAEGLLGIAGIGLIAAGEVHEVFTAIGEAHDAAERNAMRAGYLDAMTIGKVDAAHTDHGHFEQGKHWTTQEISDRTAFLRRADASGPSGAFDRVEATNRYDKARDRGQELGMRDLNKALDRGSDARKRLHEVNKLADSASRGIFEQKQQEGRPQAAEQHPRPPEQRPVTPPEQGPMPPPMA